MKILAIDDQQLILLSIKKKLTELGYHVETASSNEEGIMLYNSFEPDLVLLDMNMPEMSGMQVVECTGTEMVKYIRVFMNRQTPILVVSGNTNEAVVQENFKLGINDYLEKPASLDEMAIRIKRLIGAPKTSRASLEKIVDEQIIQKNCVGVVIPCYNEEVRLLSAEFQAFVYKNPGYHLCFVNDGSTDNTLQLLEILKDEHPDNISIYNCSKNEGKAEAVRLGMKYLIKDPQFNFVGYMDANVTTDFDSFDDMVKSIETSDYKIVSGTSENAQDIETLKRSAVDILRNVTCAVMKKGLRIPFSIQQCSAKIMEREIASRLFQKPFSARWLLDAEIFIRMTKFYGRSYAQEVILEKPLKGLVRKDNSKTSLKDSMKTACQLAEISFRYKVE